MPRFALVCIALIVAGCGAQPHHHLADPAELNAVRSALDGYLGDSTLSEREREWQTRLLIGHAHDAPLYQRLDDVDLHSLADVVLTGLTERDDTALPPLLLTTALADDDLDHGERVLLLGLCRRVAGEANLMLPLDTRIALGLVPPSARAGSPATP
ncbi:MAG: hypothetical protein ACYTF0_05390 [Planctomycetota bacterium]|jgi:hypothetical protein